MSKKKNKKNSLFKSGYFYIIIILLFVFLGCVFIMFNNKRYKINPLILNNDYDVVYQVDDVPKINLAGEVFEKINDDIQNIFDNNENGDRIEYEYDISEDTFSILLKRYIVSENKEFIEYNYYNIDLINMKELELEDLLEKYEINYSDLSFFIRNKFLNYYADLLDAGYFKGTECDFNCFIANCNFQDFMEDNVYYIKNNHLYLYKFFNIYNEYNYNDFFSYDDFVFEVK